MKWVTRSHVHVDRVACPWLIQRFVDNEAEFLFVPASQVKAGSQLIPVPSLSMHRKSSWVIMKVAVLLSPLCLSTN